MIEAGTETRLALQQRQTDHAIAQVPTFLIVISMLVSHSLGYLFHAKDRLVKGGHPLMILRVNGDVANFRKHLGGPPRSPGFFSNLAVSVNSGKHEPVGYWFSLR